MGFKTEPAEMPVLDGLSKAESKEEWINEAPTRHGVGIKRRHKLKKRKPTPKVAGQITFNLRLSEERRAQLERIAKAQDRSMQNVAQRELFAVLDRLDPGATPEPNRSRTRAEVEPERKAS